MDYLRPLPSRQLNRLSPVKEEMFKLQTVERKLNNRVSMYEADRRNRQLLPEIKVKANKDFKKVNEIPKTQKLQPITLNIQNEKKSTEPKNKQIQRPNTLKYDFLKTSNLHISSIVQEQIPLYIEFNQGNTSQIPSIKITEPNLSNNKILEQKLNLQTKKSQVEIPPRKQNFREKMSHLERWKIGPMIGNGSTSDVYRVLDNFTGSIVAGKKIPLYDDPQVYKIMQTELDILCKIQHPNIVKYYDHCKKQFDMWIFIQYVPQTIQRTYKNYGIIPTNNIRSYSKQLLQAIKYLHDNKIIHKDIKCSNILLSSEGVVKLSDFGSSKQFDQTNSVAAYMLNGAVTFKGSILWMAPEVIQNNTYGRKSDIWSFGCSVLEMATAQVPWYHQNFDNELAAVLKIGTTNQIPLIAENIQPSLRQFLSLCLVRNPEQRKSAQQLLSSPFFNQ